MKLDLTKVLIGAGLLGAGYWYYQSQPREGKRILFATAAGGPQTTGTIRGALPDGRWLVEVLPGVPPVPIPQAQIIKVL